MREGVKGRGRVMGMRRRGIVIMICGDEIKGKRRDCAI